MRESSLYQDAPSGCAGGGVRAPCERHLDRENRLCHYTVKRNVLAGRGVDTGESRRDAAFCKING